MAGRGARKRRQGRRVDLQDDSKTIAGLKKALIDLKKKDQGVKERINAALERLGVWRAQEFPPHDPDSLVWSRAELAEALSLELKK